MTGYDEYVILEANGRFVIEITPSSVEGEEPYIPRDNPKMKYHLKRDEGIHVGLYKISIEKCLEENIDLWFNECLEKTYNYKFNYDETDEESRLHKLYFYKMKKYVYYQRHQYVVILFGKITPEMLMTDEEAKQLQMKLLELNQKVKKLTV